MRPYGSFVSGLFSPEGDLDMALDGFLDYKCATVPELRSRMHSMLVECCGTLGSTTSPAARCMRQHHGDHIASSDAGTASRRCPCASRPHSSAQTCCGCGSCWPASHIQRANQTAKAAEAGQQVDTVGLLAETLGWRNHNSFLASNRLS